MAMKSFSLLEQLQLQRPQPLLLLPLLLPLLLRLLLLLPSSLKQQSCLGRLRQWLLWAKYQESQR
jgi:hypothetical protein